MKLSKLTYHKVRDFWKREMEDFSFWLSQPNNLKNLSKTIGMNLEFVKREATKNSRLRVDILAKNKENGELVIIENQLEKTDFSHLGKLLTYAALFRSNTIIWIVKDVRAEHEFAINWFSQNSKEKIKIFLIRIQLVSIGNSPVAPLFTIICKPERHIIPKIKETFGSKTIELLDKRNEIEKLVLDNRILDFFDERLELNKRYLKGETSGKHIGILDLLKAYSSEVYIKYNVKFTRDLKSDLLIWADYRNFDINQKHFNKKGTRDYKSGGKEYIIISEKDTMPNKELS